MTGIRLFSSSPIFRVARAAPSFYEFQILRFRATNVLGSGLGTLACSGVAPMRYNVVLQTGHLPRVPGVPDAVYSAFGSCISRLVLHFTQYASISHSQFITKSAKESYRILCALCGEKQSEEIWFLNYSTT